MLSLTFIDDLTLYGDSRMNAEVYKSILATNVQENATRLIRKCFILQQDNYPKHTDSSVKFIRAKKWKLLDWPSQSRDLNPIEHAFLHLKSRLKAVLMLTLDWGMKLLFTSSHLHIINRIKFMRIWRAVRGEGSELGTLARTLNIPL